MSVKLKDIAKKTGVSISSVSRILNRDKTRKFSEETSFRVFEAARQLGFFSKKDYSEEAFKNEIPYSIGCILTSEHETYVSPFFSDLLAGIQKEVAVQQKTHTCSFFVASRTDSSFPQFLEQAKLDCAIMLGRTTLENIALLRQKIPIMAYAGVNRISCDGGFDDVDEIFCDAYGGAVSAVRYLVSLGHRKIGFIGPTQHKDPVFNEYRFRGFSDEMRRSGLAVCDDHVADTLLTPADGYESMKFLIERGNLPTALFCGNDSVALGVMRALSDCHIVVPDDISILGFDNIETAAYVKPALTTIGVPTRELGRIAVKTLFDRLETKRDYAISVSLPFKLIERESCVKNGGMVK